ncbi:Helicase associated domain protein [Embleya sp. NPDC008237]|uniref:DEAD/DEAH box helicase n=1 Tax=Embleya sp. NPDC008237 TaxID=3363978 RepID=UPI0036EB3B13
MPNPTAPTARRPARNTAPALRPHQRDALAAIVRELENPDTDAAGSARYSGRRATAVMACGTGKTWVAAATAATLAAHDRVLVLVPTLDLLVQTVRAWRRAGRVGGTQVAVCSLGGDAALGDARVRATTSAPQLALWAAGDGALTVYATYQSLGTILDAHTGVYGLRLKPWRLVCIDEGHRTSGSLAKEWGAVHDDRRLPTQGRLYLTATPRVWEPPANSTYSEGTGEGEAERPSVLADDAAWDDPNAAGPGGLDSFSEDEVGRDDEGDEDDEGGAGPIRVRGGRPIHSPLPLHAVASMENEEIFGPTVHRLELAAGVRLGLLAKPRIVVVDVADPTVQNLAEAGGLDLNRGPGRRTLEEVEEYRAARLAALQTAVLRVAADQGLSTVIAYHARTAEAQACAETLPEVAKRLHETDPQRYPAGVWADWLCGEHESEHRRRVLGEFAAHTDREPAPLFEVPDRDAVVTRRAVLSNVRVLAEGVDLRADAVAFMDPKLSVIEIVQAIGRVLRQEPHEGRTATIVVPVFLAAGEQPDDMLVSDSYHFLVRVLHALAAHDSRVLDMLATPAPSGSRFRLTTSTDTDADADGNEAPETRGDESEPAKEDSEGEGAGGESGNIEERFLVRFMTERDPALIADFVKLRVIDPERRDWRRGYLAARRWHAAHGDLRIPLEAIDYDAETGTSHPVGAWISEQRRAWSAGAISARRIELLEALGMVWSPDDAAFEDGLAMCRAYFAVHGHLAAPKAAAVNNYPVGQFLANCRRPLESRKNPARWAERWERLAAIDPDWNPTGRNDPARRWSLDWQRILTTIRLHTEGGGNLDELVPGHTVGGEDVGAWLQRQRRSGAGLTPAQREALAGVGVEVAGPPAQRAAPVDRWALTLAAAAAFREREGHLTVPRKHVETVEVDGEAHSVKLGVALANARQRQGTWAAERIEALTGLGMRWG